MKAGFCVSSSHQAARPPRQMDYRKRPMASVGRRSKWLGNEFTETRLRRSSGKYAGRDFYCWVVAIKTATTRQARCCQRLRLAYRCFTHPTKTFGHSSGKSKKINPTSTSPLLCIPTLRWDSPLIRPSSQSLRNGRIESSEFAASILGGEFPFDRTGLGIALANIGVDFAAQGRLIGNPP